MGFDYANPSFIFQLNLSQFEIKLKRLAPNAGVSYESDFISTAFLAS
jgi:hypothetical protein